MENTYKNIENDINPWLKKFIAGTSSSEKISFSEDNYKNNLSKLKDDLKEKSETYKYNYYLVYFIDGVELFDSSKQAKERLFDMLENRVLLELRAFSEEREYYAIKYKNTIIGRSRYDNPSDPGSENILKFSFYDELYKIWGRPYKDSSKEKKSCVAGELPQGYTLLTEERGINVAVPFKVDDDKIVFARVRNYFTAPDEELRCTDWRIVDFVIIKAEEREE